MSEILPRAPRCNGCNVAPCTCHAPRPDLDAIETRTKETRPGKMNSYDAAEATAAIEDRENLLAYARHLERVLGVARDSMTTWEDWRGHASTREAADDSTWRLRRALESVFGKFKAESHDPLHWRGSIIHAHDRAGVGLGEDDELRLRAPSDRSWQLASGERVVDVVAERNRLRADENFSRGWWATRFERIEEWARAKGVFSELSGIFANGTASSSEPPRYAQLLEAERHRAKCADEEAVRLRGVIADARVRLGFDPGRAALMLDAELRNAHAPAATAPPAAPVPSES